MSPVDGDTEVKVRVSPDLLEQFFTRDAEGNRLRLEMGDPDEEGFYTPTITVDRTDRFCDGCKFDERRGHRA